MDGFTRRKTVCEVNDCTLGIAIQQQVSAAVQQDGAANLIAPIVVVSNATQTRLNAANHQWHLSVGLAEALAVDNHRTVGTLVTSIARGIGIVVAPFLVGRVAVDHRVHVA